MGLAKLMGFITNKTEVRVGVDYKWTHEEALEKLKTIDLEALPIPTGWSEPPLLPGEDASKH